MIAEAMLALAVFWIVYRIGLEKIRCRYCGKVNHEEHCPYAGSGHTGA